MTNYNNATYRFVIDKCCYTVVYDRITLSNMVKMYFLKDYGSPAILDL